jgi:hypothetical protein
MSAMRRFGAPLAVKMASVATVSALATAVAASGGFFLIIKSPRLPGKSGQRGYQNWIFILKNAFKCVTNP